MKSISLGIFLLCLLLACTDSAIQPHSVVTDSQIKIRADENEFVIASGVTTSPSYDSVEGEYIFPISDDIQVKPYGETVWDTYTDAVKVRVKCACRLCAEGECYEEVYLSEVIVARCDNQCGLASGTCACKMRVKIYSAANNTLLDEFDGGGDLRLLN